MTTLLLPLALAGDAPLPSDPLGVRELLAASAHHPGWVCASACLEERCGWVCDGPGWERPESDAWTRFQRERGGLRSVVIEHEGWKWSRISDVGYDTPEGADLRLVLDAKLSTTRASGQP